MFHSYLCQRSQSVQVETKQSPFVQLGDFATPQGSVLGGRYFICNYKNDFPAVKVESQSFTFVDNNTDYVSKEDPVQFVQSIELEADRSCQWLQDNMMVFAGQKSKLLIVGTGTQRIKKLGNEDISAVVDGQFVHESHSEGLLSVVSNNKMTWKDHLYGNTENQVLIQQLSQRLGLLRKLSNVASKG